MRRLITISSVLVVTGLAAGVAFAAGGGGGSSAAAAWMDFVWRCVNFVLFVGIIWYVAGNRMKEFFSGRRNQIESELQDMQTRKEEAEKKLKEVESNIANLSQEREEILNQAREQGETLRKSIISKAHEEAEQIKKQAEAKASQELEQEVQRLKAEMADRIIESAEKKLVSRLGKKEQEKLVDNYLTKVVLN